MRYIDKDGFVIEASRWYQNGDHPLDNVFRPYEDTGAIPTEPREGAIVRYFRRPEPMFGSGINCWKCGRPFHDHGWIDNGGEGQKVCPGDYVWWSQDGFSSISAVHFESRFKPVLAGPSHTEIETIAYLLWKVGGVEGQDKDDAIANWYRAESYLRSIKPPYRESFAILKAALEHADQLLNLP